MLSCIACALLLVGADPDGTVLFVQCRAPHSAFEKISVRLSGGPMVHTAVVIDGMVYESTWPRTCKTEYNTWINEWLTSRHHRQGQLELHFRVPDPPLNVDEVARLRTYAEGELGRRYMARGLWQGRETRGTYCGEFVGDALDSVGRVHSLKWAETPQVLWGQLQNWKNSSTYPAGVSRR